MAFLTGIKGANAIAAQTPTANFASKNLPAGGYVCKVLEVFVEQTKNQRSFIRLKFDILEGEYAGHFANRFNMDAKSQYGQKWRGNYRIFLPNFSGDSDKYEREVAWYKGNVELVAKGGGKPVPDLEAGYDPAIFTGSVIGILFRDVKKRINGNICQFTEPAFLADANSIRTGNFEIPAPNDEIGGSDYMTMTSGPSPAFFSSQPQTGGAVFAAAQQQQNREVLMQVSRQMMAEPQQQPAPVFQQPQQAFQPAPAFQQPIQQPAFQQPAPKQQIDLSDFEEIITDSNIPF